MSREAVAPGSLVAWWDGGRLEVAVVSGEDRSGRLRLVRPGGQEARAAASRLAFTIEPRGEVPGPTAESLRAAGERAAAMAERVRQLARSCDVGLLWELLVDQGQTHSAESLAELAFGRSEGPERAAVVQALLHDGLHFRRRETGWEPRSPESVEQIRLERRRTAKRASARRAFLEAVASAVTRRRFEPTGTEEERRYLAALRELAIHGTLENAETRALAQEAIDGSGIPYDRPHEGAFLLLRRLGEFASDDENLELRRYGLRREFPPEVMAHARRVASAGLDPRGRTDLGRLVIVTLDSPLTREIDDGLSLEPAPGGGARLGIHIADPAALVAPGDPVDREALSRAVTHYLPDGKLPMLPEPISEDAASLVAGEDRPALSFLVDVDDRGGIVGYEIVRSVVRSRARLSYDEADRVLAKGSGPFGELLRRLAETCRLLELGRVEAGAIRILGPEIEPRVDADGRVHLDRHPALSPSRRIVSEAMVLVGRVAAQFCIERGVAAIFRRQGPPEVPVDLPPDGAWDPVSTRLARRLLRRGEVGLVPGPHHALGVPAYAQATSPLRRYQDLATHRQILSALDGRAPCYEPDALQRVMATTEQAEIVSRQVERAADRYWLLRYLQQQGLTTVSGVVVALEPRPIVLVEEVLLECPVPSLRGAQLGQWLVLAVERVNPRADLLVLRET